MTPRNVSTDEQFTALVDAVKEYALFLTDADGVITTWNPGVLRVFGWEGHEFVGQPFHVIFTPEDIAAGAPEGEMETAAREGVCPDERWHVRKDGTRFFATGVLHPLWDEAGKVRGYTKVVTDATARHETEQRLARKAALIDLSPDAIFVEPPSGGITFWSAGAEATYGWRREEALGRAAHELLRTRFPVPREDILARLEHEGRWEGDLDDTHRDGTRIVVASRWVLQRTEQVGLERTDEVLVVNRDVTELRRLEAAREAYTVHQERIAEALQRSLLVIPPPDIFPGLTVKVFYSGAEDDVLVGGDFFDIYGTDENRVALVVGDATGKGLEAAAYTAEVKFALRALLREFRTPAAALTRLNGFICDKDRLGPRHLGLSYVAVAVVVMDTATGAVEAAVAGMEMPLLLRADGETVTFGAGGLLLGASNDTQYVGQGDVLNEGDLLVMTTDGLTEARHPARRLDFFGDDGLREAVWAATARTASLSEAAQMVVAQAREFAGGAISDDVCLLLARRMPTG